MERGAALPVETLVAGCATLGWRMLAQMAACHGSSLDRMFPERITHPAV
jgi:hypothetical protein